MIKFDFLNREGIFQVFSRLDSPSERWTWISVLFDFLGHRDRIATTDAIGYRFSTAFRIVFRIALRMDLELFEIQTRNFLAESGRLSI